MTIAVLTPSWQAQTNAASLPTTGSTNGAGGDRIIWLREMERSQIEAWLGRSVALPDQADERQKPKATTSEESLGSKTLASHLASGGSAYSASATPPVHAVRNAPAGVAAAFIQARARETQMLPSFVTTSYLSSHRTAVAAGKQVHVEHDEAPPRLASFDADTQAPVRVTAERMGHGIRLWLGVDRGAVPQTVLQQLVGKLRSALDKTGMPLLAVMCNGNAYRLAPAVDGDFSAAADMSTGEALPVIGESALLNIVEMRRRHGH